MATSAQKSLSDIASNSGRLTGKAWGLLLVVGAVFLAWVWSMSFQVEGQRYFVLGDDAMISMRHAYFLAHGQGLVWNPGQRVEGFTNLGWTLIMAAVHGLPLPLRLMSLVVQLINLALHLVLTAYVYRFVRVRVGEWPALGAALLVGLDAPLLAYGLAGFETSLQTLLVTVALLRFVPVSGTSSDHLSQAGLRWVPLWCALAFFVRPDAVTLFVTGSAAALWVARDNRRERQAILWLVVGGVLLIVGILAFQKWYYGYWFPNTYYLKASADTRQFGRGLKYIAKFVLQEFHMAFVLAPLVYLVSGLRQAKTRRDYLPAALILAAWVCYIVWVGGDVFYLSRFWAPIIPMLAVCTVLLLCRWQREAPSNPWKKGAAAVLIVLLSLQLVGGLFRVRGAAEGSRSSVQYAVALGHTHLPPGTTIGVFLAGTTPYFMPDTRFHDLLGKCDTHIAHSPAHWGPPGHNKWEFAYSLDVVKPRYIITDGEYPTADPAATDKAMRRLVSLRKDYGFHPSLWLNPLFRKDYVKTTYSVDGEQVHGQDIYVRKSP